MRIRIRDARDEDGDQIIALIRDCYAEYPGCVLDIANENADLKEIATAFERLGGRFWVAEDGEGILGCVGLAPGRAGGVGLKKLYVAKKARKRGLGNQLCQLAEAEARLRWADYISSGQTRASRTRTGSTSSGATRAAPRRASCKT